MLVEQLAALLEGCRSDSEIRVAADLGDALIHDRPIIGVTCDSAAPRLLGMPQLFGAPTLWIITSALLTTWPRHKKSKPLLRAP